MRGELLYTTLEGVLEEVRIGPGCIGVAAPGQYHVVKPLSEDTEMFIRFHAKPGENPIQQMQPQRSEKVVNTRFKFG